MHLQKPELRHEFRPACITLHTEQSPKLDERMLVVLPSDCPHLFLLNSDKRAWVGRTGQCSQLQEQGLGDGGEKLLLLQGSVHLSVLLPAALPAPLLLLGGD